MESTFVGACRARAHYVRSCACKCWVSVAVGWWCDDGAVMRVLVMEHTCIDVSCTCTSCQQLGMHVLWCVGW